MRSLSDLPFQPAGENRFLTTNWSCVLAARGALGEASRSAFPALCEAYWYPLYAYLRRKGYQSSDAQDLTQAFFARLLEREVAAQTRSLLDSLAATGTANVAFHGGSFDGSTLSVSLIKDGDQWKLDKITDIPSFNFPGLVRALTAKFSSEGTIPPQVASCIVQAFNNAGADQVKSIILSGNGDQLTALFSTCVPSR